MKLMLTVPHSGEIIPPEAEWLTKLDPLILLTDVDRFVDQLYGPACQDLNIPMVVMKIHRYVLDLNRLPTDIDPTSVEGAPSSSGGGYASGFHWVRTTKGYSLLEKPISQALHEKWVAQYYVEFHQRVLAMEAQQVLNSGWPRFHLDLHSMPSVAQGVHRDAGQVRPDVVVSDCSGKSCSAEFKDQVIAAYQAQGFRVAYNWPYLGGRMTETYGQPEKGRHSVQVELNRALYMDEETREKKTEFDEVSERLGKVLSKLQEEKA